MKNYKKMENMGWKWVVDEFVDAVSESEFTSSKTLQKKMKID